MLNLRFHVQSEPPGRAQFEVPSSSVADVRATSNLDDRVLTPGTAVSEMFVYPPVSTLGIGASIQVGGLIVRGLTLGEVTISSHVHAEPDQGYLFPTTRGNDRTTTFTIT